MIRHATCILHIFSLLAMSGIAGADMVVDGVPLKVASNGIVGEDTYKLEISQSVDESSASTHITSFTLVIGKRRYEMPMDRLRDLKNPRIESTVLRKYNKPLPAIEEQEGGLTVLTFPTTPRISARVAHGFESCIDAEGDVKGPPAEGIFTVEFDLEGQVQEIEDFGPCEVCADRGLRCDDDL